MPLSVCLSVCLSLTTGCLSASAKVSPYYVTVLDTTGSQNNRRNYQLNLASAALTQIRNAHREFVFRGLSLRDSLFAMGLQQTPNATTHTMTTPNTENLNDVGGSVAAAAAAATTTTTMMNPSSSQLQQPSLGSPLGTQRGAPGGIWKSSAADSVSSAAAHRAQLEWPYTITFQVNDEVRKLLSECMDEWMSE
eukprot:GHVU01143053.1.p1 GENE.GHVU01143053.1~~GHVU01143053.1.p1  ORF type:complete len:193 (-),score=36.59 GHVU01143053.1:215-793(-)